MPVFHKGNAVGEVEDTVIVGHHNHRPIGAEGDLGEEFYHRVSGLSVEGGGRLIAQDQARLVDQGPGNGHALLLPAGELSGKGVNSCPYAKLFEQGHGLRNSGMAIYSSGEQGHGRILGGRERWKQLILLEDETQVLTAKANALLTGHPVDVFAQHFELATARIQQSSDDRQQRGLARAAWPNQKGHLTQWHIQIHIPQHQRLGLTTAELTQPF
jgi:hypothetical protein